MTPNERAGKNHDELFPGHVSSSGAIVCCSVI
jgi:hypothetical protein